MGKSKRPCLDCRRLFLPTADKNSYCPDCFVKYNNLRNQQRRLKPKKKDTRVRGTRAYDDPQYRKYRKQLLSMATQCGICLKGVIYDDPFQVDHIIPLALGGSNDPNNLRVTHRSCNIKKKDKRDVIGIK